MMRSHQPLGQSDDEARLAQLDALIREAREHERREAKRKAEEERQRAEHAARSGGLTLEDLEQRRAELAARVLEQQTHLKADAERELRERRAERLKADIEAMRSKLDAAEAELAVVERQL